MSQSTVSGLSLDMAIGSLFDMYDTNKDGKLSVSQLVPLFESTLRSLGRERIPTLAEVKDFVNTFDINQDGEIDVEEMKAVFKKVLSKAQNS